MKDLTRARVLVLAYYGEDWSPTDENVEECHDWLLMAGITRENAKTAIEAETGIQL